jgi:RimJ/RimL family protein N-acetyltransferase
MFTVKTPTFRLIEASYTSSDHLGYLYSMLRHRLDEPDCNISHTVLPTWKQHVAFLRTRPYRQHFIITEGDGPLYLGVCYVSHQDEIGIWIDPLHRRHGLGRTILEILIRRHERNTSCGLKANVAKTNFASALFFLRNGFVLMEQQDRQYVFERVPSWGNQTNVESFNQSTVQSSGTGSGSS